MLPKKNTGSKYFELEGDMVSNKMKKSWRFNPYGLGLFPDFHGV